MKNKLLLDTSRTIKNSLGKYALLIIIVFMGVSFFAGMLSISSAMGQSVDSYLDDNNLFDFQLFSNYGFDDDDINSLKEIDTDLTIEGGHFYDVQASFGETDYIFRIESFNEDNIINEVQLVDGRYPTAANEILAEAPNNLYLTPEIGDIITIERAQSELDEIFEHTEYTVVGLVNTPNYMSLEKGSGALDSLTINSFLYIPEEAFVPDFYTVAYISSKEANSLDFFGEDYSILIDTKQSSLENVIKTAQLVRAENVKSDALSEYNSGLQEYNKNLDDFNSQIKEAQDEIDLGLKEIEIARQQLPPDPNIAAEIEAELDINEKALEEAQLELSTQAFNGQKEFDDILLELDSAKAEIDKLEDGEWTLLTREMHYSMATYKDTVNQMQVIGLIFPIFFFLVAALVCLTTMKRMVDEQRGQIGIFRALGYSKFKCASKYLIYALSATLIGGVLGAILGIMIFPPIVYGTWSIMYNLPQLNYETPFFNMIVAVVIFLILMGLTTFSSIIAETAQVTSVLLRPKAPISGKKVFLEKIPFVWNRFSFTNKVTARNLIRYKQRFFMSVFGIAGCTCLLVSGFGMQGSIAGIADIQYKELTLYSALVSTSDNNENTQEIAGEIKALDESLNVLPIATYASEITLLDEELVAYAQVYDKDETLKSMNSVRSTDTNEVITLSDDSLLISYKLAELLGTSIGDEINIKSANGDEQTAIIGGIYEKYINHEIFMSQSYYETLFGEPIENNALIIDGDMGSQVTRDEILKLDNVSGITLNESIVSSFENISTSMNIVVAVIIISAAALAFVVLSNLTSINISERKREIATLKVLGFRHSETKDYIFKENMILTIFGAILGVFLGIWAHNFIITQVEMDFIMFIRSVSFSSIAYSVILTFAFSVIINRLMLSRLRKIDMIESLKSVE